MPDKRICPTCKGEKRVKVGEWWQLCTTCCGIGYQYFPLISNGERQYGHQHRD